MEETEIDETDVGDENPPIVGSYKPKEREINEGDEPRFRIRKGKEGFYLYDMLSLDVVKKDGKFFITNTLREAEEFRNSLFALPYQKPRKLR